MKTSACIALVGAAVLLAGCISSLHPFYTEKDLVFDPDLVGCWSQGEDKETWKFLKKDKKVYELVYTGSKGKSGKFDVHLFEVEGKRFIDMLPKDPQMEEPEFYKFHLLPMHGMMHVKQVKPTLQLQMPNPDWLQEHLKEHPDAIAHEVVDDRPILTASTGELQKFWRRHLETKGAFGDPCSMTKRKDAETKPEETAPAE